MEQETQTQMGSILDRIKFVSDFGCEEMDDANAFADALQAMARYVVFRAQAKKDLREGEEESNRINRANAGDCFIRAKRTLGISPVSY